MVSHLWRDVILDDGVVRDNNVLSDSLRLGSVMRDLHGNQTVLGPVVLRAVRIL